MDGWYYNNLYSLLQLISSNKVIKETIEIQTLKSNMQMFSLLGSALFISVIGIMVGYSLDLRNSKNAKCILCGSMMAISSFALTNLISLLDEEISDSKLLGAMCGALTTTPGLSAIVELDSVILEDATLAYSDMRWINFLKIDFA